MLLFWKGVLGLGSEGSSPSLWGDDGELRVRPLDPDAAAEQQQQQQQGEEEQQQEEEQQEDPGFQS